MGYRVNSRQAVRFRQWATRALIGPPALRIGILSLSSKPCFSRQAGPLSFYNSVMRSDHAIG
ncbi:MAG: hypothetical protein ACC631_08040 [Halocynthiibacter sp.]